MVDSPRDHDSAFETVATFLERVRLRDPITVDFYLYSTHEVAVFEPIWRCLRQRGVSAEFVLEPPGVHRAMGSVPDPDKGWFNDHDGPIAPLMDDATHQWIVEDLGRLGAGWIDRSRVHADAVVTTQGVGWLLHYGAGLRIRAEYGASAFVDVYGHGPVNRGMDAVLAHGPFSAHAINAHVPADQVHLVGYPKWAPTLRGALSREDAREALGLPAGQPVLAWLPTWAHHGTIDAYAEAMSSLSDDHLVVIKPHHNTMRFETARLTQLDPRIVIRSDLHSLVPLMLAADVVVADSRSGALAESIIADRPAVGLLPGIDARANGVVAELDEVVVFCQTPDTLAASVADALATDRSTNRQRWRAWLFAELGGNDDFVAADKVIELVSAPARRSTSGLSLSRLDELIDAADGHRISTADCFAGAWPLWPGHPRLLALLQRTRPTSTFLDLRTCARLVRQTGHGAHCPLRATAADPEIDPVVRLLAAATIADDYEDPLGPPTFARLCAALPADRFADAIDQLEGAPGAIPVFIQQAATSPERCHSLAVVLDRLGAGPEAQAMHEFGMALVNG